MKGRTLWAFAFLGVGSGVHDLQNKKHMPSKPFPDSPRGFGRPESRWKRPRQRGADGHLAGDGGGGGLRHAGRPRLAVRSNPQNGPLGEWAWLKVKELGLRV